MKTLSYFARKRIYECAEVTPAILTQNLIRSGYSQTRITLFMQLVEFAKCLSEQEFHELTARKYSSEVAAIFDYPLFREGSELPLFQQNWQHFNRLVSGKRVCIVGPSRSFLNLNYGGFIDSFDLVVRLNFQWPLNNLEKHLGERMDILYHCCNGDYPISDICLVPAFAATKFVCFEVGVAAFELLKKCESEAIPTLPTSGLLDDMRMEIGTYPNTGAFAIRHMLQFPIKELFLAGLTFYRENYYAHYRGDGAKDPRWLSQNGLTSIWKHDFEKQLSWFLSVYRRDPRIHVDIASAEVMDLPARLQQASTTASS